MYTFLQYLHLNLASGHFCTGCGGLTDFVIGVAGCGEMALILLLAVEGDEPLIEGG